MWINKKDALPKEGENVVAWMDGITVACWFEDPTRDWWEINGNDDFCEWWMPLPAPPTAEQCGTPAKQQATPAGVPETQIDKE